MRLSQQAIEDFQKIYYKETGEMLSDQDAEELGIKLLILFDAIYKPLPLECDEECAKNHYTK